jgi:hypothetical protein
VGTPIPRRLATARRFLANVWRWRTARTFDDLLAINIRRILAIRCDPAWATKASAEVELNRCGMLTGAGVNAFEDYSGHRFRAGVTGFADDTVKAWLTAITADTDFKMWAYPLLTDHPDTGGVWCGPLWCIVNNKPHPECPYDDCIAEVYAQIITIGQQRDARGIFQAYPVRRSVGAELRRRWQVTILDPNWGSSNLFDFLLNAAREQQGKASVTR